MKEKQMRILLVANMYPSKKHPHYGIFVRNTKQILSRMDQVVIKKVVMTKQDRRSRKLFAYLALYIKMIGWACSGRYDVLYGHFLSHLALPILLIKRCHKRIKLVVNVHGNDVVPDQTKDEKWIPMVKRALPLIDQLIVPSTYFKSIMMLEYAVPEEKIAVFPSGGVDRTVFYPKERSSLCEKFKLDPTKRYIGFVSRIERHKGWDTFLHMISVMREDDTLRFIVVGDGDELSDFNELANQLGITKDVVRYALLSQSDIADLFNVFELFCFPTYRKSDSLGLVGLEAMACDTLVIASDRYGPSTYMRDGVNGFTMDATDPKALCDRIRKALALSEEEKNLIRKQAQMTVDQYDIHRIQKDLIHIFEQLR